MKPWAVRMLVSLGLVLVCLAAVFLFGRFPELFFPGYRTFSKGLMTVLSSVTGIVPFAVWDFAWVLLILTFFVTLTVVLVRRKGFLDWLSHVLLVVSALGSFAVLGWMLNHYAPPLRDELALEVRAYTKEELAEAFGAYAMKAASCAGEVERDAEQEAVRQDFYELAERGGRVYEKLGERYEVFRGSGARVKALVLFDQYLLYRGNTGEFMPLTGESTLPHSGHVLDLPFTMAHEAAHRLGIASEEEANFAAFLACEASEDPYFRYSGYYTAFIYLYNALYEESQSLLAGQLRKVQEAYPEGCELLLHDTHAGAVYYQKYEGPVKEAGTKVNDTYLKSFGQESGVKSYGEVVDDLVAWYRAER